MKKHLTAILSAVLVIGAALPAFASDTGAAGTVADSRKVPGIEADRTDASDVPAAGAWTMTEKTELTEEARDAFQEATSGILDVGYEPVALLGTQVVSGMNYCFLARVTAYEEGSSAYELLYVYRDPAGKAEIIQEDRLDIGLAGQDFSESDQHTITLKVADSKKKFVECPESARAGEEVIVQVPDVADGEIRVTVDEQDIGSFNGEYQYVFTMPDRDVVVHVWVDTSGYTGA